MKKLKMNVTEKKLATFLFAQLLFVYVFINIQTVEAASYESAWFPAPSMYLTQIAYESYSHGSCNAIDIAPGGRVFAPFTGKIMYLNANWGYVLFQSTDKVYYADGTLDYMTVGFMHDSNISDLYVGQTISQGTAFYDAGGMGAGNPNAYGYHVDISVLRGRVNSVTSFGRGNVYAYDAFFINRSKTTSIVNKGQMESGNTITNGNYSNWSNLWKELGGTNDPLGNLDEVTGGTGKITVRGWAFDRDALGSALRIDVYVGGPAGSGAPGYNIYANKSRPDVNNAYPGVGNNHGFEDTIYVSKSGTQTVYVYAINAGGGTYNPLIGQKTVTIGKDSEKPKISNVSVTTDGSGYKVTCTATDNVAIDRVQFPTWTVKDGQDDIDGGWVTSKKSAGTISGNTVSFIVKRSDHNKEFGKYVTHIYAYDKAGNSTCYIVGEYSFDLDKNWDISLSQDTYTYDGTQKQPTVSVTTRSGSVKLTEGMSYKVSYQNNTEVGTAEVAISGIGNYSGTVTKYFTIKEAEQEISSDNRAPSDESAELVTATAAKTFSISKLIAKKKGFQVKWKKQKGVSGYQIQYSRYSSMKKAKTVLISGKNKTSRTVSRLSGKKKYYVRIRTYKMKSGKRVYSSWSATKSVRTK